MSRESRGRLVKVSYNIVLLKPQTKGTSYIKLFPAESCLQSVRLAEGRERGKIWRRNQQR